LDESIGISNYYAYGFLPNTNLSQPCYVKVGKGGWLYGGNGLNIDDGGIMRDLAMIIQHAPWNGEWIGTNSWNYDSGFKYYPTNGGTLTKDDQISIGLIASEDVNTFVLRILLFAYDSDGDKYVIAENVNYYSPES
jgi:hypothetical protein